ncbi:MAG: DUF4276 family protein [Magnetococcales bacterium]|nr:DUF4276 family protein [Magnetococcales bacterium]MBF0322603.1 DUF4276 family protein [Magnetococcales bacterium]
MHFEILVEGQTEKTALSILMEKIVGPYGNPHTWSIHKHQGIGSLPEFPDHPAHVKDRTLLHNLPGKLRAYGKEANDDVVIVILVDLDKRTDCRTFKQELVNLLKYCEKTPKHLFRIAIEELEAWFLGDRSAILAAYPDADQGVLDTYVQDAQINTWEKLAEAIDPNVRSSLGSVKKRSPLTLKHKHIWAKNIAPKMDVENNASPSFTCFRDGLRRFIQPARQVTSPFNHPTYRRK